jgi:hypothetical protein
VTMPDREVSIHASSWTALFSVQPADVQALWQQAVESFGTVRLAGIERETSPELSLDVLVGEDDDARLLSLWLGETRLARVRR